MSFFKRLFAINTVRRLEALDDHILCDLGLSREDLYEAHRIHRKDARFLQERAAERAISWIH